MQPDLEDTQLQILQWSSKCSYALGEYFDICKPLFSDAVTIHPKLHFVLYELFKSCHLTSESVFILIGNMKLWDSDILIRSIFEGTIKYLFLSTGKEDERNKKLDEYWDDIPQINRIKDHLRIQEFLSKVDNLGDDEWKPFQDLLLTSEELIDLQSRYPRTVRKQLEQKWSFNEIAQSLAKPENDFGGYDAFKNLLFSYGMASHMVHQDANAISIIWDRNSRETERRTSLELAHGARGLSDLISMAMVRAIATYRLHGKDITPIKDLNKTHELFLKELHTAYNRWFEIEYGKFDQ